MEAGRRTVREREVSMRLIDQVSSGPQRLNESMKPDLRRDQVTVYPSRDPELYPRSDLMTFDAVRALIPGGRVFGTNTEKNSFSTLPLSVPDLPLWFFRSFCAFSGVDAIY